MEKEREREEERDYQERNFEKNKLLSWHLMKEENLIQLDFDGEGAKGCTYMKHSARYTSKKLYIILCQFTLKHNIFVTAFYGECNRLFQHGQYTHCCHRICADCLQKFIAEGSKCQKCPNVSDIEYLKNCVKMLELWNCRNFEIHSIMQFHEVLEGCRKFT